MTYITCKIKSNFPEKVVNLARGNIQAQIGDLKAKFAYLLSHFCYLQTSKIVFTGRFVTFFTKFKDAHRTCKIEWMSSNFPKKGGKLFYRYFQQKYENFQHFIKKLSKSMQISSLLLIISRFSLDISSLLLGVSTEVWIFSVFFFKLQVQKQQISELRMRQDSIRALGLKFSS